MYLFIRQPESGKAPIETIMPEVVRMPLYRLINDPLGTVLGVENVKMADFKPQECLEASLLSHCLCNGLSISNPELTVFLRDSVPLWFF
jgi:hypothetical protein